MKRRRKITASQREALINGWETGLWETYAQAAKACDMSTTTAYWFIRDRSSGFKFGGPTQRTFGVQPKAVTRRKQWGDRLVQGGITARQRADAIVHSLCSGEAKSYREAGAPYGLSSEYVRRLLGEHGQDALKQARKAALDARIDDMIQRGLSYERIEDAIGPGKPGSTKSYVKGRAQRLRIKVVFARRSREYTALSQMKLPLTITPTELARMSGCSITLASKFLRETRGWKRTRRDGGLPATKDRDRKRRIVHAAVNTAKTLQEIADDEGCSKGNVEQHLKAAGLPYSDLQRKKARCIGGAALDE